LALKSRHPDANIRHAAANIRHPDAKRGISPHATTAPSLAALLVVLLRELMGLRSINLSLDDFYHTHQHRQQLARTVHPLLATRGVPGTHDVELAVQTLKALGRGGEVAIPRFNKAIDDRAPMADWPRVLAPLDIVFLEGWCLCIPCEDDSALQKAVNPLEAHEDSDARWRRCGASGNRGARRSELDAGDQRHTRRRLSHGQSRCAGEAGGICLAHLPALPRVPRSCDDRHSR
jgi:hypothetical protein